MNTSSKYVLVKGMAGIGNRLLAVLTAALYARLSGRRLLVDWTDPTYSSDGTNVFRRLFVTRDEGDFDLNDLSDVGSVAPRLWRGRLRESVKGMFEQFAPGSFDDPFAGLIFSFDLTRLDHAEDVLVLWSYVPLISHLRRHLRGDIADWRHLDDDAILRRLMHETLEPRPAITDRVLAVQRGCHELPLIGVHARHTDRRTNLSRLKRGIDAARRAHPQAGIFLSTDDPAVEREFTCAYPGVVTQPKWYPPSGRLHGNKACPDRGINAEEALADLYLLAGCPYLVVERGSSFGRLAGIVGASMPTRLIDVRPGGWLPAAVHEAAWRTRAHVRWGVRRWLATKRVSAAGS